MEEIGRLIRAKRKAEGLSLTEFANRAGLSKGYISQVEHGQAMPSISSLQAMAQALNVPIASFFPSGNDTPSQLYEVVRADQRRTLRYPDSPVRYQIISFDSRRNAEFVYVKEPPGTISHEGFFLHEGEEVIFVIAGTIEYCIGEEKHTLTAGDAIWHKSTIPHKWKVIGDEEFEAVAAITPPSF